MDNWEKEWDLLKPMDMQVFSLLLYYFKAMVLNVPTVVTI